MTFRIKTDKKETENKCIRFSLELIEQIYEAIKGTDISFSKFVIQACEYALENMEQSNKSKQNKEQA